MVCCMKRKVYAHKLGVECVSWPATWREHFKHRWFPAWAQKRWPVRFQRVDVTAYHNYPSIHGHQSFLDFEVTTPVSK